METAFRERYDLASKPFVKITIPAELAATPAEKDVIPKELEKYLISQIPPDSKLRSVFTNPKNYAFRGFQRNLRNPTNSLWGIPYEETLKTIDRYGVDKETDIPNPRYPIWITEDSPDVAISYACEDPDEDKAGFILIYKGADSITQDPYSYKEFGIFFDHTRMGGDEDLETFKGRLVGVIEIRFI